MDLTLPDSLIMVSGGGLVDSLAAVKAALAETNVAVANGSLATNNSWMMLSAALVFIMHLGFASVESGFTQAKNTVNILFKNTMTVALGLLSYALLGFGLMYPGEFNGFLGFAGPISLPDNGLGVEYFGGSYTYWTDFLFQAMFAATCATIVSGAVAERIKIQSYLLFTLFFVGLVYPITGSWKCGGGFLQQMETPFYDFAGSTLVHSVGGWGALAGVMLLGARAGKFTGGDQSKFAPSNFPLATIGVFLLWLGWFGFNGGSVLSADPALTSLVLVTTSLAAAAGAVGAMFTAMFAMKKLDFGMVLNGILAGLVGITAGADQMSPYEAMIIGLISGGLVVLAVLGVEKLKLDDPVGAISVHLVCGVFGTLAVGIFGDLASPAQFMSQLIGVACYGGASFAAAMGIFTALKYTIGIRVSAEEELAGLDKYEHGATSYAVES